MNAPGSRAYTVLVVDDNRDLLDLIAESLIMLGDYTIVTAENGAEGLERAFSVHPDCMVIDIKMPDLDGYQLIRALRGDSASASMPLVILSALVQEKDRLAGMLVGADQYLTKPIKPPELVEAIQEAIRLSQEERQRRVRALLDDDSPPDHL
jgi:two-component system alkaline phosphatase synthesis response regulator PhoP